MQLQTKDWVTEREQWKENHSLVLTYSSLHSRRSIPEEGIGWSLRTSARVILYKVNGGWGLRVGEGSRGEDGGDDGAAD